MLEELSLDVMTGLRLSIDWKGDNYDVIIVVVNCCTKMVHYKPVKTTIDSVGIAKVIMDVVVKYHSLLKSII